MLVHIESFTKQVCTFNIYIKIPNWWKVHVLWDAKRIFKFFCANCLSSLMKLAHLCFINSSLPRSKFKLEIQI